jgi:hypothetical protein
VVRVTSALVVVATASLLVWACSGGAVGVDTCKRVESARCANAQRCNVDISQPPHSSSLTEVQACEQYYNIACLHGLATSVQPSTSDVTACIDAIDNDPCEAGIVLHPEDSGACSWLIPPAPPADAGIEAEAGVDATVAMDAGVDSAPGP